MNSIWESLTDEQKQAVRSSTRTFTETEILEPLKKGEKPSIIRARKNISEQSQINGYIFSKEFREFAKQKSIVIPKAIAEGTKPTEYANLLRQFTSDSAGSPAVGENSITIWVDDSPSWAGTNHPSIDLHVGDSRFILIGGFSRGAQLKWKLTNVSNIPADDWDSISLEYGSSDALRIKRVKIVHSSVTIVDWTCHHDLSTDIGEGSTRLCLAAKILKKKLSYVSNSNVNQIHWAATEIGKTDGTKYGSHGAWCSEFVSWCLRKSSWDSPPGNIASNRLQQFFMNMGRLYPGPAITAGGYKMKEGDYVRIRWNDGGYHSALFLKWVDSPTSFPLASSTRFKTIEGNVSATVKVVTRRISDVYEVGSTY
jgi:hypothetical protein